MIVNNKILILWINNLNNIKKILKMIKFLKIKTLKLEKMNNKFMLASKTMNLKMMKFNQMHQFKIK